MLISDEAATCTCPWQAKHLSARGPCKHILAVQIVLAGDSPLAEAVE